MPRHRGIARAFHQLRTLPSVASGRTLVLAMLALLVCDVVGGFLAVASGVHTWDKTWGFNAKTTVPLPIGVAQLVLAWLAARNVWPPAGRIAAVLLTVFCAISVIAGMFDGDFADHVSSHGWLSWQVIWAIFLLPRHRRGRGTRRGSIDAARSTFDRRVRIEILGWASVPE